MKPGHWLRQNKEYEQLGHQNIKSNKMYTCMCTESYDSIVVSQKTRIMCG